MKILIKVTKEVLEKTKFCPAPSTPQGGKYCSQHCAIAYAIREIFPTARVGSPSLFFRHGDADWYTLPREVCDYIQQFDTLAHQPYERLNLPEFSFEIDIPQSVIDQIGLGEVYKILSESKTLELVSPLADQPTK